MPEVVKNFGEHKLKGEFRAFLKLVAADRIPMDKCIDVGAYNPSAHMQETSVTELHSPATRVFNTVRPKKLHFAQLTCLWVFLRNLFRNFVNVLLKFIGYDKKRLRLFG